MANKVSELQTSLQGTGMSFLLSTNFKNITNQKEQWVEENFACISAMVCGRPALIFSISVMYPVNYEKRIEYVRCDFLITALEFNKSGDLDIYLVGLGLINKNESKKYVFASGDKYSVALGSFVLLKPSNDSALGFSTAKPVDLSSIDEEYYFVSRLEHKYGRVINVKRDGSIVSESEQILDCWTVTAAVQEAAPLMFKYVMYTNAYSKFDIKNPALGKIAFFNLKI